LLDVLGKRIDDGAFVITFVCPEEPVVNERVDLAMVKFDRKTAVAGPDAVPRQRRIRPAAVFRLASVLMAILSVVCSTLPMFSVTSLQCYCTRLG
jgi:hypothetical protein